MNNQTVETLIGLWSLAVQEDPQRRPSCRVEDGNYILTIKGKQESWAEVVAAAGVPSTAEQTITGDVLTCVWPSYADAIFGSNGLLAQHLPNYEVRIPQLHMARMVQRAIEMGQPAVIEAGTGVGKSFAYAAVCMMMGKRVVISTSNKALQMQLYRKDIPFLQTIFPGKKVALVQGKQNYVCHTKVVDKNAGAYTIQGDLLDWYLNTTTGNTEEIPFAVEPETLRAMTADAYCAGKHCDRYGDCFYYLSKVARADADVLICNHMLLAMHQLYPGAGILSNNYDVIVVDEAHKFADYMRNAVGTEFGLNTIEKRLRLAEKYDIDTERGDTLKRAFFRAITDRIDDNSVEHQIGVDSHDVIVEGERLAGELLAIADEIWEAGDMPSDPEERKRKVDSNQIRNLADAIGFFSKQTHEGHVRWIEVEGGKLSCRHVPFDVSKYVARMAGFEESETVTIDYTHCTRCNRKLTAETVAVLEGLPYGPDCIRHVDIMGDAEHVPLAEWLAAGAEETPRSLAHERTPIIFCSATLAAPDMAAFLRECGLPWALQMVAASPFDYEHNALLYVPAAIAPAPGKSEYDAWLVEEIDQLVRASEGGAFCLFTSYRSMRHVEQRLRVDFERKGWPCFIQGQMPKLELVKRFVAAGNGVLFATKSFWEGVSIDGDALRLVVIDKIPFEAPSPLNTAQEAALRLWAKDQGMSEKQAEWYPFEALRVPKAIIDLKQGAGRLIRTHQDWGCIAILDSRLRAAQYARRMILPALPPARLTARIHEVDAFFQDRFAADSRKIADLSPVEQVVAVGDVINGSEIPF